VKNLRIAICNIIHKRKAYLKYANRKLYMLKLFQEWGGIKENDAGDKFKYAIFDIL
jgi:hypothetical protein